MADFLTETVIPIFIYVVVCFVIAILVFAVKSGVSYDKFESKCQALGGFVHKGICIKQSSIQIIEVK